MPTISVEVTPEVAAALGRQARSLLIARGAYVRSILATVAQQASAPGSDGDSTPLADPSLHPSDAGRP